MLEGEWQGVIRVQDVRATEKDKVKIFESFRPGDIVRAVVVSYFPTSKKFDSWIRYELIRMLIVYVCRVDFARRSSKLLSHDGE